MACLPLMNPPSRGLVGCLGLGWQFLLFLKSAEISAYVLACFFLYIDLSTPHTIKRTASAQLSLWRERRGWASILLYSGTWQPSLITEKCLVITALSGILCLHAEPTPLCQLVADDKGTQPHQGKDRSFLQAHVVERPGLLWSALGFLNISPFLPLPSLLSCAFMSLPYFWPNDYLSYWGHCFLCMHLP